jgi:hypothetical protein
MPYRFVRAFAINRCASLRRAVGRMIIENVPSTCGAGISRGKKNRSRREGDERVASFVVVSSGKQMRMSI